MKKLILLAVVLCLFLAACTQNSSTKIQQGPLITLKVYGPGGTVLPGAFPTLGTNNKTYFCLYSGGNSHEPNASAGSVELHARGTFPIHLDAQNQFNISTVFYDDPQFSTISKQKKQVTVQDDFKKMGTFYYIVRIADASTNPPVMFDCDPMIINH